MKTPSHIFVATDLSPLALHAMGRGHQLAQSLGARLSVMQALGLDALGPLRELLGESADEVTQRLVARQQAAIVNAMQEAGLHRGVPAAILVEPGLATRVVPAAAAASQADLVVIGAKGDGTLRRHLIGSTASNLLRKSSCPVLVVKHACKQPYQRVLVPVDFSPGSALALRCAQALAPQAQLVLLHSFHVPFEGMLNYAGVSRDVIHRYQAEAQVKARRQLFELVEHVGLDAARCVVLVEHGDAVQHILAREAHARADLVVMGKHGTHVTEELLLGSVTQRVLADAHADVLVVVDPRGPTGELG